MKRILQKKPIGFVKKRNSKKRKAESSPEISSPNVKNTGQKQASIQKNPIPRPHPLMVSGVSVYKDLYQLIKKIQNLIL